MTGVLYGLGIGPGDPGLITVKARDVLARVPVIAYPAPEGGESLVRAIAAPHVPPGRREIVIATPMAADRFPAQEVYDRYAGEIEAHLRAGHDVAVLCEGDPFLYGSFMYLFERLAERHEVVVVPGVSSLGAVAAAAGVPLASRNDVLTVLPATVPEPVLASRLAASDAAAIMKVGRNLDKVRRVLRRLGLEDRAWYVERATMARERVLPLAELGADERAPYFSTILVGPAEGRRNRTAWGGLPEGAAIVALSASGLETARRLQAILPASRVHGLASRVPGADCTFDETRAHLASLFVAGVPIVGVCAAAILVRALARVLANKRVEPPVLAIADDLSAVVPLLGGHRGANRLARAIATETGAVAAITTAGDLHFDLALDEPPSGWRVGNPEAAKAVTAALLAGEPVGLTVEAGDACWLERSGAPFSAEGRLRVVVTDQRIARAEEGLVLHPPVLSVGVGCERGADPAEVIGLVEASLERAGLARGAVACVASVDIKADEAAVHAVADALAVPARFFPAKTLEAETPRLANPSDVVFREVGCHGVAEAAALAAAGPGSTLVVEKTRSRRATCAIARAEGDLDPLSVGWPRGRLTVVGIGPGDPAWRTPEAMQALVDATDVVGYGLYLDLVADAIAGKTKHAPPMGQERERARLALELAAEGRSVALVSSGDAGIYGLAALVFELLDREDRAAWNRVEIAVAPGLTACQAAAARIGAPLGHDFCAISLSDLLTPWPEIERRLAAAADGDFVVALYNPVSQRRRSQLLAARDILLRRRPPATPVALGRNLGREGETVDVIRLDRLVPECADMLTVIIVGNSETRLVERGSRRFVYTPRGYGRKIEATIETTGEKASRR